MGAFHFCEWLLGLIKRYGAELNQIPLHSLASSHRHQWPLALETELLCQVLKVG